MCPFIPWYTFAEKGEELYFPWSIYPDGAERRLIQRREKLSCIQGNPTTFLILENKELTNAYYPVNRAAWSSKEKYLLLPRRSLPSIRHISNMVPNLTITHITTFDVSSRWVVVLDMYPKQGGKVNPFPAQTHMQNQRKQWCLAAKSWLKIQN